MPDIPYKYLQDENGETFYPVTGSSSMVDPVPITKGGTGADNVEDAITNLGFNSDSNYCKMPDGTLMQWGLVSVTAAASSNGNAVWTFPLEFYDTNYLVQTTAQLGTVVNTRSMTMASGRNTTNVTIYWRNDSSASYTMQVSCFAIGRWK